MAALCVVNTSHENKHQIEVGKSTSAYIPTVCIVLYGSIPEIFMFSKMFFQGVCSEVRFCAFVAMK